MITAALISMATQVATISVNLERDRREPDKVLTYVQQLRRLALDAGVDPDETPDRGGSK